MHDTLGLGDEGATVEVRGAAGTVERVGERQTLVRPSAPVPAMLNVFAYDKATTRVRGVRVLARRGRVRAAGGAGMAGLVATALRPRLIVCR